MYIKTFNSTIDFEIKKFNLKLLSGVIIRVKGEKRYFQKT